MGGVCILPTSLGFCLPPVWPAVHCECIEDSRLSAVIGLRRSLWRPLAAAAEGAETHLPTSQSVSAEGVTRRSAPGQVCGLALLTRLTCPHLDGRPPTAVGRVSSPRGVLQCLMPRNNIPHRIFYTYICHHPKPGYNVNVSCIATYTLSSIFFMYDNDGNTETDRTGAAQDYHLTICILILRNFRRPPPNPMMYMPARL